MQVIKLSPELAPRTRSAAKSALVQLDQIDFPANARPTNAEEVGKLVKSIRLLGLQSAPTVVERNGRYKLVAGRHRIEALRVIGRDPVPVRIVDFDDIEARLWTISENLHRNELNALQRAGQVAEFALLSQERMEAAKGVLVARASPAASPPEVMRQVGAVSGGRGNEGGNRAAARYLGLTEQEVRRSVKIDSITPAAKEAAREAGIDSNQSVLLKVASYADDDQVEAVADIAKARADRAQAPAPVSVKPLRNLVGISGGELARWIKITTPNDRPHVIRVLEMAAAILRDEFEGSANASHDAIDIETREARRG